MYKMTTGRKQSTYRKSFPEVSQSVSLQQISDDLPWNLPSTQLVWILINSFIRKQWNCWHYLWHVLQHCMLSLSDGH